MSAPPQETPAERFARMIEYHRWAVENIERTPEHIWAKVTIEGEVFVAFYRAAERALQSPAPTPWAYSQACAALEKHRQRADMNEAAARTLLAELDRHYGKNWCIEAEALRDVLNRDG